jgi:hypothetical protein
MPYCYMPTKHAWTASKVHNVRHATSMAHATNVNVYCILSQACRDGARHQANVAFVLTTVK